MAKLRPPRIRQLSAIVLGLLAALVIYLPPLELAQRLDARLFDFWTSAFPAHSDPAIVLVDIDDPAWLTTLADLAKQEGARLLVTTIPHPPSPHVNELALGPTELALNAQMLRRTEWEHGGHLWFETAADGVVRAEHAEFEGAEPIPSLGFSAFSRLSDAKAADARDGLIRYLPPNSFQRLTPAELQNVPARLKNRVVIAGRPTPQHDTPIGPLPDHEILAQILAGYTNDALLKPSVLGTGAAWLLALFGLAVIILRPYGRRRFGPLTALGAGGLMFGFSGAAFAQASVWVPVAGPGALLAIGSLLLLNPPKSRRRPGRRRVRGETPRALLDAGRLEDAWAAYRAMPPTKELFTDLYELGDQLEADERHELAADIFHRIALVDVRYSDVARRLVRASHMDPDGADDAIIEALRATMPERLGRYELLEPIGKGATGRVYLARDPEISRLVAIKVIDLNKEIDPAELAEAKDRFRREAETAGRLNHPNIVTIFDIGEAADVAYIAMEYLKGRHLSDFTVPESLLPVPLVLELGALAADALDFAHARNVIHRDIKPSNIMYDSVSGDLKLTDFGIARLIDVSRTRTGIVLGTPSFMSPEQLEGRNVNGHTDLFALGVSLYELLTGRLPFRGASMTTLMFVIANEPHEPITTVRPDLPQELDSVIDTALNKDADARFSCGAEMADALRAVAGQLS